MRNLLLSLALLPFGVLSGSAQQPRSPDIGSRLRLSTAPPNSPPNWIVGTLLAITADHMTIRLLSDTERQVDVARASITRLDVSRGQQSRTLQGFGLGFAGGAAAGALLGYALDTEQSEVSPGATAAIGGIVGAVGGGLIGAIIGASRSSERWERLSLATNIPDRVFGSRQRLTLSLALTF